jgi:hypothetical protein
MFQKNIRILKRNGLTVPAKIWYFLENIWYLPQIEKCNECKYIYDVSNITTSCPSCYSHSQLMYSKTIRSHDVDLDVFINTITPILFLISLWKFFRYFIPFSIYYFSNNSLCFTFSKIVAILFAIDRYKYWKNIVYGYYALAFIPNLIIVVYTQIFMANEIWILVGVGLGHLFAVLITLCRNAFILANTFNYYIYIYIYKKMNFNNTRKFEHFELDDEQYFSAISRLENCNIASCKNCNILYIPRDYSKKEKNEEMTKPKPRYSSIKKKCQYNCTFCARIMIRIEKPMKTF